MSRAYMASLNDPLKAADSVLVHPSVVKIFRGYTYVFIRLFLCLIL